MVESFDIYGMHWILKYDDGSEVRLNNPPIDGYDIIGETKGIFPFGESNVEYEEFGVNSQNFPFFYSQFKDYIEQGDFEKFISYKPERRSNKELNNTVAKIIKNLKQFD